MSQSPDAARRVRKVFESKSKHSVAQVLRLVVRVPGSIRNPPEFNNHAGRSLVGSVGDFHVNVAIATDQPHRLQERILNLEQLQLASVRGASGPRTGSCGHVSIVATVSGCGVAFGSGTCFSA